LFSSEKYAFFAAPVDTGVKGDFISSPPVFHYLNRVLLVKKSESQLFLKCESLERGEFFIGFLETNT